MSIYLSQETRLFGILWYEYGKQKWRELIDTSESIVQYSKKIPEETFQEVIERVYEYKTGGGDFSSDYQDKKIGLKESKKMMDENFKILVTGGFLTNIEYFLFIGELDNLFLIFLKKNVTWFSIKRILRILILPLGFIYLIALLPKLSTEANLLFLAFYIFVLYKLFR